MCSFCSSQGPGWASTTTTPNVTIGTRGEWVNGPTYWRIREGEIAGQVSFPSDGYTGTVIDVDAEGRVLGVEGIDGLPDLRAVVADPRIRILREAS